MPRPHKNSLFRDFATLKAWVEEDETHKRKAAPKVVLSSRGNSVYAVYLYKNATRYLCIHFEPTRIGINMSVPFTARDEVLQFNNSVLVEFGWYMTRQMYGTKAHRNSWVMKRTNRDMFSARSDFEATYAKNDVLTMDWSGKVLNGWTNKPGRVDKLVSQNQSRARAMRRRMQAAIGLGFIDATKLWGYKLPKDISAENVATLNSYAKALGFIHVAHAWACDVKIHFDEYESAMVRDGAGALLQQMNEKTMVLPELPERKYRHSL